MIKFEQFISDYLSDSGIQESSQLESTDLFSQIKKSYFDENRNQVEDKSEADLFSQTEVAKFDGAETLNDIDQSVKSREAERLHQESIKLLNDELAAVQFDFDPIKAKELEPFVSPEEKAVIDQALQKKEVAEEDRDGALSFSIDQAQKLFGQSVQTFGDFADSDFLRNIGNNIVQQQVKDIEEGGYQSKYNLGIKDTIQEEGFFGALGWIAEKTLENFASTGFALAGTAAAAVTAPLSAPLATALGVSTLAGTVSLGVGEVRSELEEEGVYDPDDADFAIGAGLVVGIIDKVFAGAPVPKGEIVKGLAKQGIIKKIGSNAREYAARVGTGAGKEFVTEATQEAIVVGSAALQGAEYETSEVFNRLLDAAVVGGAIGGGFSTADVLARGVKEELNAVDLKDQQRKTAELEEQNTSEVSDETITEELVDTTGSDEASNTTEEEASLTTEEETAPATEEGIQIVDEQVEPEVNRDATIRKIVQEDAATVSVEEVSKTYNLEQSKNEYRRGQALSGTKAYQQNVFESYASNSPDLLEENNIDSYSDLLNKSVEQAKIEIESLFNKTGLNIRLGREYSTLDALDSDITAKQEVGVGSTITGGLLGDFIPDTDVTYAEALSAIKSAYGYVGNASELNELGNVRASNTTIGLFSELANVVVRPNVVGSVANNDLVGVSNPNFITPYHATSAPREGGASVGAGFSSSQAETSNQSAVSAALDANPEVHKGERQVGEVVDEVILQRLENILNLNQSQTIGFGKFRGFIKHSLFNTTDEAVSNIFRRRAAADQKEELHVTAFFENQSKQVAKKVAENYPDRFESEEDAQKQIRDLKLAFDQNKITLDLLDPDKSATLDNVKVRSDGFLSATNSETSEQHAIPPELADIVSQFQVAREQHQRIAEELLNDDIQLLTERQEQLKAEMEDIVQQLSDTIAAEGVEGFKFLGLGDKSWVEELQKRNENIVESVFEDRKSEFEQDGINKKKRKRVDAAPHEFIRENLFVYISERATQVANARRLEGSDVDSIELSLQMQDSFFKALESSKTIEEFIENTGDFFVDGEGNLSSDYRVLAALGAFENKKQLRQLNQKTNGIGRAQLQINADEAFIRQMRDNKTYTTRLYRLHFDRTGNWLKEMVDPKTAAGKARKQAVEDAFAEQIALEMESDPDDDVVRRRAKSEVDEFVRVTIENKNYDRTAGNAFSTTDMANKVSLRRGDHAPVIRAFMGEITDPDIKWTETLRYLSFYNNKKRMVNEFYNQTENGSLFIMSRSQWANTSPEDLGFTDNDKWTALEQKNQYIPKSIPSRFNINRAEQVMVTPELSHTIDQAFETVIPQDGLGGWLASYSNEFRAWKTVRSLPTAMLNIFAGGMMPIVAGGLSKTIGGKKYGDTMFQLYGDMAKLIKDGKIPDGERGRLWIEALLEVSGSEARVKDIARQRDISTDLLAKIISGSASALETGLNIVGADTDAARTLNDLGLRGWTAFNNFGEKTYMYADLSPKLYAYMLNKEMLMDQYGMSPEQARQMAGEYARDGFFDYSEASKAVKQIRDRTPLGGGFLIFQQLIFNVTFKHMQWIKRFEKLDAIKYGQENIVNFNPRSEEDVRSALTAFRKDPEARLNSVSAGKAGSFGAALLYPVALSGMIGVGSSMLETLFGGGDDEEYEGDKAETSSMMSRLLPEYYQLSDKAITGTDENGNVNWIDMSRFSNFGPLNEAWNALFSDDPTEDFNDSVYRAASALVGPFFTESFGIQTANEILNNETRFGQIISDPDNNLLESFVDYTSYGLSTIFSNTGTKQVKNLYQSLLTQDEYNEFTGEKVDAVDALVGLMGFKINTFDPVKQFSYASWLQARNKNDGRKLLSSRLKSFNELGESEIQSYLEQARSIQNTAYEAMLSKMEAAKYFGLTDEQIINAMKTSGFSKKDAKMLLTGKIPVFDIEKLGVSASDIRDQRQIAQGAKDNFRANYDRAREVLNNL